MLALRPANPHEPPSGLASLSSPISTSFGVSTRIAASRKGSHPSPLRRAQPASRGQDEGPPLPSFAPASALFTSVSIRPTGSTWNDGPWSELEAFDTFPPWNDPTVKLRWAGSPAQPSPSPRAAVSPKRLAMPMRRDRPTSL
ncbi:hypothetical protein HJFPF1_04417 [Paramyrothecium foliicola]|nr:hypothetical protein HJFPF1_04417 [Paramyrothecium foliicola]